MNEKTVIQTVREFSKSGDQRFKKSFFVSGNTDEIITVTIERTRRVLATESLSFEARPIQSPLSQQVRPVAVVEALEKANSSFHRTCAKSRAGPVNSNVRRRKAALFQAIKESRETLIAIRGLSNATK